MRWEGVFESVFWDNLWCGESFLNEAFPMLYHIARKKDTFVAEYLCWHNGIAHWDVLFVRPIQDWELTSLESFFDLPCSSKVDGNEEDKVVWVVAWSGSFEVKSFYSILSDGGNCSFPWKSIWKVKAHTKLAFFTWKAVKGRILTFYSSRKRNICFVKSCCMCKQDWEELVGHLLIHCPFASDLWSFVFSLFGISWVKQLSCLLIGIEVVGDIGWHLFGVLFRNVLC